MYVWDTPAFAFPVPDYQAEATLGFVQVQWV